MSKLPLPDPETYEHEGSEVGDVAVGMEELSKAYIKVFPDQYEQFSVWPRSWQWQGIDSCYKLQWLAQLLLDNNKAFEGTFKQGESEGRLRIELQGLIAKNEPDADEDSDYWGTPITGLRMEFDVDDTFFWLETRSVPAVWVGGTDPEAPATHTFYFSEWDEDIEQYVDFILLHFFEGEFVKDVVIENLPVVDIENEEDILPLWNCLWGQRSFSGIGADHDFANHGAVLTQLAYSADKAWMKFLVQCSEHALYNNGWSPNGVLTNGGFQALENMHSVEINTPDGQVKYEFDDFNWSSKGEITLDNEPIKFTDPRFRQWLASIEQGQWQWVETEKE